MALRSKNKGEAESANTKNLSQQMEGGHMPLGWNDLYNELKFAYDGTRYRWSIMRTLVKSAKEPPELIELGKLRPPSGYLDKFSRVLSQAVVRMVPNASEAEIPALAALVEANSEDECIFVKVVIGRFNDRSSLLLELGMRYILAPAALELLIAQLQSFTPALSELPTLRRRVRTIQRQHQLSNWRA